MIFPTYSQRISSSFDGDLAAPRYLGVSRCRWGELWLRPPRWRWGLWGDLCSTAAARWELQRIIMYYIYMFIYICLYIYICFYIYIHIINIYILYDIWFIFGYNNEHINSCDIIMIMWVKKIPKPSTSHKHCYRWYVYHSQMGGLLLFTSMIYFDNGIL